MKTFALASLILCLSVSGCVGGAIPIVETLSDVPQGQVIVAGQVKVVVSGSRSEASIVIVPEQGGTVWHHYVDPQDDGAMYWQLPPGTYYIAAVRYLRRDDGARSIRPMRVRFTIPPEHKVVYIGSLVFTFDPADSSIRHRYTVEVEDEYARVRESLERKFPGVTDEMAKHLMSRELLR